MPEEGGVPRPCAEARMAVASRPCLGAHGVVVESGSTLRSGGFPPSRRSQEDQKSREALAPLAGVKGVKDTPEGWEEALVGLVVSHDPCLPVGCAPMSANCSSTSSPGVTSPIPSGTFHSHTTALV